MGTSSSEVNNSATARADRTGSSSVTERKNRLAAFAYGGAKVSLIGKEKRRRRRSVDVPSTRAESTKDPPGVPDATAEGPSHRPRPPSTRSSGDHGDKISLRQAAYRSIATRARAVEKVREGLRERGRLHSSPTPQRDTSAVETPSSSPLPPAPIVTVEELPAGSQEYSARHYPIYVDSSDEDAPQKYSDDEDFEVEEVEDEEIEVEEEEEPPPVLNYRAPPRESPPKPVTPVTPTVKPVASNETKEEAPRNAHRWGVRSGTTSSSPKRSTMAARQDDTLPAPSRFVSLPSLIPRQPQPRSSNRQGGSNESSPPSKQLVNEKLPPLSSRGTPTSVLKNRLAAVAYGAMASRSLKPTPPPAKLPAPPISPREPESQQGVRAARVQQSTMIANDIYEDFKKGFVPLRELVARKKAAEKKALPQRKPSSLGRNLWMVALSAVKWKSWVRRSRSDGVTSPRRIKSPVRLLSPVRSKMRKDEWARSLDRERKRMSLTTHRSESNTSRESTVVRPGAFGSEPEPVSLGTAAADNRAAAAYSKTQIKILTKRDVNRARNDKDAKIETPRSSAKVVATPPQWIKNPLAHSAAAARRRRFLTEMAAADADPELSRPSSRAPTRPSSPKLGKRKETPLDRLRGAVKRLMEYNRNMKRKSLQSPPKRTPDRMRDAQQRAEWAQRMHTEDQAAARAAEHLRRKADMQSSAYVRPGAFGSEASPVQMGVAAANQRAASAYSMLTKKPTPRKLTLSPIAETKKLADSPPPPKEPIASPLTQKLVERARRREAQLRRQRRKSKPKRKGFKSTSDSSVQGDEAAFSAGDMRDIEAQYRSQARERPGQGRAGVKRGVKSEWAMSLEREMRMKNEVRLREEAQKREASPEHVPRVPGVFDATLTPVELGAKAAAKRAAAAYTTKRRRKKPEKDDDDAYSLNFDSDELSEDVDFDSDWDDDEVYLSAELDAHFDNVSPIIRQPSVSPEPSLHNAFVRDIATDILRDACEAAALDVAGEVLREVRLSAALADILGEVSAAAVDVAELDSAFAHDIIYSALDLCDIEETVFQTVYDCADDAADAVEIDAVVFGQMERAVQACELDDFILDVVYDIVDTIPTTSERWKEDMAFEAAAAERMAFVTKLKDKAASEKGKDHPTSRSTSRASTKIEELQQKLDALREQHKQAHENIHEKRRWGRYLEHTPNHMLRDREFNLEQSESIWDEEPAVALRYRKNPLYDPILETNDDILEWEPNEPDAFVLPESVADPDESVDDLEEVTPDPRRQRAMAKDELAARAYRQKQQLVSSPKATPKKRTKLKDELPTGLAIKRAERAERIAAKTRIAHEKALLAQGKRPPSPQPWEDDELEADLHEMFEEERRIREAELAEQVAEQHAAARKIQAMHRGRMARKHVQAKRAEAVARARAPEDSPGSSPGQENHSPGGKKKRKPKTISRSKVTSPLESVYSASGIRRKVGRSLA